MAVGPKGPRWGSEWPSWVAERRMTRSGCVTLSWSSVEKLSTMVWLLFVAGANEFKVNEKKLTNKIAPPHRQESNGKVSECS